jgi:hypothetical protein
MLIIADGLVVTFWNARIFKLATPSGRTIVVPNTKPLDTAWHQGVRVGVKGIGTASLSRRRRDAYHTSSASRIAVIGIAAPTAAAPLAIAGAAWIRSSGVISSFCAQFTA